MIPVLFRIPEWIPLVGNQAITSFGAVFLLALLAAGSLSVRRPREHQTHTPAFRVLLRKGGARNDSRMGGWRLFGLYLVLGGAARALVELVRLKPDRLAGPITVDFLLALTAIAVGMALRTGSEQSAESSEAA